MGTGMRGAAHGPNAVRNSSMYLGSGARQQFPAAELVQLFGARLRALPHYQQTLRAFLES